MILQNGKELAYKKWQEKVKEPIKIMDVKELEVLWPTRKIATKRNHPWR